MCIGADLGVGPEEQRVGGEDVLGGLHGEEGVVGDCLGLCGHEEEDD